MGAGFPLLLEGLKRYGRDIGAAYGSNTLGAAAGALLPLLLLPAVGWSHAMRAVAAAGLIVRRGSASCWIGAPRGAAIGATRGGSRTTAVR